MGEQSSEGASKATWFVGASFGGTDDQTQRFLADRIWEVKNPTAKEVALIRAMQPGERIAIKAAYTRKNGVPFDNHGRTVSVMAIKAVGTIVGNPNDGERIQVDWQPIEPPREWYFYTYRSTIWRVVPDDWMSEALVAFAFEGKPQDVERFCNEPFWRERFGSTSLQKQRFEWTDFYEAVAENLLRYAGDRRPLIEGIHQIAARVPGFSYLQDKFPDGSSGPLRDTTGSPNNSTKATGTGSVCIRT